MEEKRVTSLEEMKLQARGQIVKIPGWSPGMTVNVRVRRVDLTAMIAAAGALPNVLAAALAKKDPSGEVPAPTPEDIEKLLPVLDAVAREALVEPTYEQIVREVAPLTLDQKVAIFDAALGEVKALQSFRRGAKLGTSLGDSENVGPAPE